MQLDVLRRMRLQVAALAAEDSIQLDAAREHVRELLERLKELEQELSGARSREETVAGMAHSSGRLLVALDKQLEKRLAGEAGAKTGDLEGGDGDDACEGQGSATDTVLTLLKEKGEATTKEVVEYVQQVRPELHDNAANTVLTRLVKRGLIERPRNGVYRLLATT
ncbi:BlaI/MecI/CopY family transcriptional regulator [Streptomyces sp. SP2-10]|uniref:BlaI/MecI/CopY family transcriptional regulator n=1 Tax=Streptomyces sp. SP2-10 TaxID=2873385 RepID=UPI001CA712E9|nr:BlaI/MecI/CopY family transcriptional regulator [Streptomyces sp. SP2-10]MBY8844578.1 BlaI/MecI/CopY family transcriptional regulator [Streptomyces sp. SP2-10]